MSEFDNVKAYLDGELTQQELEKFEQALENDRELQKAVSEFSMISDSIKTHEAEINISGAEKALNLASNSPSYPVWIKWAGIGVSALLVVFVIGAIGTKLSQFESLAMSETAASSSDRNVQTAGAEMDAPTSAKRGSPGQLNVPGQGGFSEESAPPSADLRSYNEFSQASPGAEISSEAELPPEAFLNHSIIKTGSINLTVDDVEKSVDEVENIAKSLGGLTSDSSMGGSGNELYANIQIRVPANSFDEAMNRLEQLGRFTNRHTNASDVTAEVADVDARLKAMRAEEDQYLSVLGSAKKIGEILEVKERIAQVRREIEALEARQRTLKSLTTLSTIDVSLSQEEQITNPEPNNWIDQTVTKAVNGLKSVGKTLLQGLIYIGIFSPIWLPIVLVAWYFRKKAKGN